MPSEANINTVFQCVLLKQILSSSHPYARHHSKYLVVRQYTMSIRLHTKNP